MASFVFHLRLSNFNVGGYMRFGIVRESVEACRSPPTTLTPLRYSRHSHNAYLTSDDAWLKAGTDMGHRNLCIYHIPNLVICGWKRCRRSPKYSDFAQLWTSKTTRWLTRHKKRKMVEIKGYRRRRGRDCASSWRNSACSTYSDAEGLSAGSYSFAPIRI